MPSEHPKVQKPLRLLVQHSRSPIGRLPTPTWKAVQLAPSPAIPKRPGIDGDGEPVLSARSVLRAGQTASAPFSESGPSPTDGVPQLVREIPKHGPCRPGGMAGMLPCAHGVREQAPIAHAKGACAASASCAACRPSAPLPVFPELQDRPLRHRLGTFPPYADYHR